MGFIASEEVDVLDYDFRPFVEATGVTPEPSTNKIQAFQKKVKTIFGPTIVQQAKDKEHEPTAKEIEAAFASEEDGSEQFNELLDAVSTLCSAKPTTTQIKKLPYRLQRHFVGYIFGKFFGPEA